MVPAPAPKRIRRDRRRAWRAALLALAGDAEELIQQRSVLAMLISACETAANACRAAANKLDERLLSELSTTVERASPLSTPRPVHVAISHHLPAGVVTPRCTGERMRHRICSSSQRAISAISGQTWVTSMLQASVCTNAQPAARRRSR